MDKGRYQRLIWKLVYLSQKKPYIAFLANKVSQFMNNSTKGQLKCSISNTQILKTDTNDLFLENEKEH